MKQFLTTIYAACFVITPMTVSAMDSCLVGVWEADLADLADMMQLQMGGTARPVGGQVSMEIGDTGTLTILSDNMTINVQVPGTPAMDVKVTGYSAGSMTADDGIWLVSIGDYNLVGSADVLGQPLAIPFTSASGMFGGGAGPYRCSASAAYFETGDGSGPPRMPRNWRRIR